MHCVAALSALWEPSSKKKIKKIKKLSAFSPPPPLSSPPDLNHPPASAPQSHLQGRERGRAREQGERVCALMCGD